MFHRDDRLDRSASRRDSSILGRVVRVVRAGRGECRSAQCALEVRIAGTGMGGLHATGGLVRSQTGSRPTGQVSSRWKASHVHADLGDDDVSHSGRNARNRDDQVPGGSKKLHHHLDALSDLVNGGE